MDKLNTYLSNFIELHQLPTRYVAIVEQWYLSLVEDIYTHQKSAKKCLVIGINGAQGSGKSTLAALLVHLLTRQYQLNTISLSLDDFYYTRQQRQQLADTIHPLFMTRGVPGTHDIELATRTIEKLKSNQLPVQLPRFDKSVDDRFAEQDLPWVNEPVDIIVLEGWCLGTPAQSEQALQAPVNDLEQQEDAEGVWRRHANQQLAEVYPDLFNLVDSWIMLKAPSFECIYNWRQEQEQKLQKTLADGNKDLKIMDEKAVQRFIKFYQRITEHTLSSLPDKVDYLYTMDSQRNIIDLQVRKKADKTLQWLVYTDMDGSLLDHHTYRYDEAIPVIKALEQQQIPLIPISSKTAAELELFRDNIDNHHPFIVENGAAVYIPQGYFDKQPADTVCEGQYWIKEFVAPRQHWQSLIAALRPEFGNEFKTFAEVGIDGIINLTGLNVHAAARAARRHYGEPVSWHGNGHLQQQFIEKIEAAGAHVLQGGRFMHISGDCDKGKALQWLSDVYQQQNPHAKVQSLAIGDSQNDVAMLEQADYALLIRSPVHPLPHLNRQHLLYVSADTGPKGWAQGVSDIVDATLHPDSQALPRGNHG